jgi:predicted lipoprotein with Yx(FWY)xxD motif
MLFIATVAMLALTACSDDGSSVAGATSTPPTTEPAESPTASPSEPSETPSSSGRETEVESEDSSLGVILTDGKGNTLYAFDPDAQGAPTCYDDCAAAWPPFIAKGELKAGGNSDDLDAGLLDTVERDDGGSQVTYNGWPLYFFSGDEAPGDTNGQGSGDVWHVISPDGDPITG